MSLTTNKTNTFQNDEQCNQLPIILDNEELHIFKADLGVLTEVGDP